MARPLPRHREDIKAEIRKRGATLADLSRRHGYCDDAVRIALSKPWPQVERIIADFLDVKPEMLWPDRYVGGRPKAERREWKSSDPRRAGHRQKEKAA